MKVTNNVLNGLAIATLVAMTVGCASVDGVTNKMVNNTDKSGVIYGTGAVAGDTSSASVCKGIANKDKRCAHPEDYSVVVVISKFGFADGAVGINALVKNDFPNLAVLKHNLTTNSKMIPFVKAKVVPGQLGELVDIVSTNGDGKCVWSGLPRVGGVVCPAYNWDYTKDNQAAIVFR